MEEDEVLVDEGKRKEIFATAALTPGLLIRFPSSLAWEKKCFLPPSSFRCGFPQAEEEKNAKLKTAQQFPVVELRHIFMPMQQSGGFVT